MSTGVEFRSLRESRGLTIEAIAAATRIAPRMIAALERNDLSALPPRPYARGFVAAYGRELGLDPTETVTQYFAQFEPPAAPTESVPEAAAHPVDRPRGLAWPVAIVCVAIALIIPLVNRSRSWQPRERGSVGTSGIEPAPATDGAAPVIVPRTTAPASVTAPLTVSLTFEQPCWIAASADGARVVYRMMEAGATQTLRARQTITIRVGNAGGVKWSVNGGPATRMGAPGEVRTVSLAARDSTVR